MDDDDGNGRWKRMKIMSIIAIKTIIDYNNNSYNNDYNNYNYNNNNNNGDYNDPIFEAKRLAPTRVQCIERDARK